MSDMTKVRLEDGTEVDLAVTILGPGDLPDSGTFRQLTAHRESLESQRARNLNEIEGHERRVREFQAANRNLDTQLARLDRDVAALALLYRGWQEGWEVDEGEELTRREQAGAGAGAGAAE